MAHLLMDILAISTLRLSRLWPRELFGVEHSVHTNYSLNPNGGVVRLVAEVMHQVTAVRSRTYEQKGTKRLITKTEPNANGPAFRVVLSVSSHAVGTGLKGRL
jgi:hypothetical protein